VLLPPWRQTGLTDLGGVPSIPIDRSSLKARHESEVVGRRDFIGDRITESFQSTGSQERRGYLAEHVMGAGFP